MESLQSRVWHFFLCLILSNCLTQYFLAGVIDFDYTKYPDKEYQLEWIKNYLCYKAELNGGSQADVSENDVEEFYVICSKFALVCSVFTVAPNRKKITKLYKRIDNQFSTTEFWTFSLHVLWHFGS